MAADQRAAPRNRGRLRPTSLGLAVTGGGALCLGLGTVAAYPGLLGLGLALLALAVLSVLSVLVPVPLRVERWVTAPQVPRLGECRAVVRLENGSTWWPLELDGTEHVGGGAALPVRVASLGPGRTVQLEVDVPTDRRGTFTVGPLTLTRRGLLGLVTARSDHGLPRTVTVVPRVLATAGPPPGVRRGHIGADERVEHGGTDLIGLREYIPGDDLRRLHWATSARTGVLMVRQDADPSEPHLTVLLDDREQSYVGDGFEEAVDTAASLVAAASRAGNPVRLRTVAGDLDHDLPGGLPGSTGGDHLTGHLLTELAALHPATATGHDQVPDGAVTGRAGGQPHQPDVVAIVSGSSALTTELVLAAERAPVGVVLVVDRSPGRVLDVSGRTTVLSGPRAEDLTGVWSAVAP